ncbi:hypothetical protein OH76DRAFT_701508 [Lentinus brumalis]|uniref:Uncharacterized protein n=1 Tax=Lentinus brumalis TaxID=2498619 RepID=A0A371D5S9_9APHY|nr:hypothetical protein OH76DRAFT_701508 [Polyporus brumalis]
MLDSQPTIDKHDAASIPATSTHPRQNGGNVHPTQHASTNQEPALTPACGRTRGSRREPSTSVRTLRRRICWTPTLLSAPPVPIPTICRFRLMQQLWRLPSTWSGRSILEARVS